jgi:hypothetical protein
MSTESLHPISTYTGMLNQQSLLLATALMEGISRLNHHDQKGFLVDAMERLYNNYALPDDPKKAADGEPNSEGDSERGTSEEGDAEVSGNGSKRKHKGTSISDRPAKRLKLGFTPTTGRAVVEEFVPPLPQVEEHVWEGMFNEVCSLIHQQSHPLTTL